MVLSVYFAFRRSHDVVFSSLPPSFRLIFLSSLPLRPTEFLPVEYANVRGVEPKMYKEQEGLAKKSHKEIEEAYVEHCSLLDSYGAVFFPARVSII